MAAQQEIENYELNRAFDLAATLQKLAQTQATYYEETAEAWRQATSVDLGEWLSFTHFQVHYHHHHVQHYYLAKPRLFSSEKQQNWTLLSKQKKNKYKFTRTFKFS